MTEQAQVQLPEPASKQEMINKLIAPASQELPLQTEAEQEVLAVPPETSTETVKEEPAKKTESKSAKAARESRELRAARAEQARMKAELESLKGSKEQIQAFTKAQQLFKTNPKEAIKLLGGDPLTAYQQLTDSWLNKDKDMAEKDPVQKKLESIDPYLESIKKREAQLHEQQNQINITNMIANNVTPIIETHKDKLECLYNYFTDDKSTPDQIKKAVAKSVFDNADIYYDKNYGAKTPQQQKEQHAKFLKEFGNYETYFTKVAEYLEKQLEQQLETAVQAASKLKKFKDKVPAKKDVTSAAAATLPVLDPDSSDDSTLDQVVSALSKTSQAQTPEWRPSDYNKRAAINALLAKNGLKT